MLCDTSRHFRRLLGNMHVNREVLSIPVFDDRLQMIERHGSDTVRGNAYPCFAG